MIKISALIIIACLVHSTYAQESTHYTIGFGWEAQYLAGHTSIAGTEKYRQVNLEDLQNQVNKYHPLK